MPPSFVNNNQLIEHIRSALAEDIGTGDVTTRATIPDDATAEAEMVAKEAGTVAGCELADIVFYVLDADVETTWTIGDGDEVETETVIGSARGNAGDLLRAERLVLNYMQRMSGIATATSAMVKAVAGSGAKILDTRKTVPGLRALDKWAVSLGGGQNHRYGLFDMILIKDNHIAAAGGVEEALRRAEHYRTRNELDIRIEIEAKTLDQVRTIVDTGLADIVMLDNMAVVHSDGSVDVSELESALEIIGSSAETEASGNVTLETVRKIAATGVDAISSGALTHSVTALDISMNVVIHTTGS